MWHITTVTTRAVCRAHANATACGVVVEPATPATLQCGLSTTQPLANVHASGHVRQHLQLKPARQAPASSHQQLLPACRWCRPKQADTVQQTMTQHGPSPSRPACSAANPSSSWALQEHQTASTKVRALHVDSRPQFEERQENGSRVVQCKLARRVAQTKSVSETLGRDSKTTGEPHDKPLRY